MTETIFAPVQQNQRIAIIDMLRGWALLGVVLMNYIDFYRPASNAKGDLLTNALAIGSSILFAAKSWTLLSFLFGYGFAVLMQNTEAKGINPAKFFTRRMFWLLVLAVINSAFFYGDILKDYAVLGLMLLLFHRCSGKTAFYMAIGLLLAIPAVAALVASLKMPGGRQMLEPLIPLYKSHNLFNVWWFGLAGTYKDQLLAVNYFVTVHVVMLCCFFLGLAAQKVNFFARLTENKRYIKRLFWGSLAVFVFLLVLFMVPVVTKQPFFKYYRPMYWSVLSMMLFTASTLCWLYLEGKLKGFFAAMQVIGKMTLTNYMMQNIIGMLLFSGFGLGLGFTGKMHFGLYLLLALVVYIIQIYWSRWWLSKYNYGPVEWLWRQLSYGKRLPLTRKQETNLEIFARAVGELPKKYPDYFNNHQANIDPRDPDADFIVYYNGYIQYVRFAPFSTLPDNIRDEIKHIYHDIYGKTDSRTGTDFSPYT